jgi:hypothetical protein
MLPFCTMDGMFSVFTNTVVDNFLHKVYMHATEHIGQINCTCKGIYHESGRSNVENYWLYVIVV